MQQIFTTLQTSFSSRKTYDISFRKEQLRKFMDMILTEREAIQKAVYSDLKKPASDVLLNEIQLCINEAKLALSNLDNWSDSENADKKMANMFDTAYIRRDPKGIALVIAPWNFPIQLSLAPFASLIASGCVGILKPSEVTPHTSTCLKEIFSKYMDPSYYTVIEGGVKETTELLKLPFNHIFYTGSTNVGKIIMRAAAEHLATVTLELGGANPCYLDGTVDLKTAAKRICWLKSMNCGQICLSINYLFIKADLVDMFIKHYKTALGEMYGTDIKASPDYSRIVNENHFERITKILNKVDKSNILVGSETDRSELYIAPSVVKASMEDKWIQDELFAPILPIIPVDDFSKSISFASSLYLLFI